MANNHYQKDKERIQDIKDMNIFPKKKKKVWKEKRKEKKKFEKDINLLLKKKKKYSFSSALSGT